MDANSLNYLKKYMKDVIAFDVTIRIYCLILILGVSLWVLRAHEYEKSVEKLAQLHTDSWSLLTQNLHTLLEEGRLKSNLSWDLQHALQKVLNNAAQPGEVDHLWIVDETCQVKVASAGSPNPGCGDSVWRADGTLEIAIPAAKGFYLRGRQKLNWVDETLITSSVYKGEYQIPYVSKPGYAAYVGFSLALLILLLQGFLPKKVLFKKIVTEKQVMKPKEESLEPVVLTLKNKIAQKQIQIEELTSQVKHVQNIGNPQFEYYKELLAAINNYCHIHFDLSFKWHDLDHSVHSLKQTLKSWNAGIQDKGLWRHFRHLAESKEGLDQSKLALDIEMISEVSAELETGLRINRDERDRIETVFDHLGMFLNLSMRVQSLVSCFSMLLGKTEPELEGFSSGCEISCPWKLWNVMKSMQIEKVEYMNEEEPFLIFHHEFKKNLDLDIPFESFNENRTRINLQVFLHPNLQEGYSRSVVTETSSVVG